MDGFRMLLSGFAIWDKALDGLSNIFNFTISLRDVLDILAVSIIFFLLLRSVRDTRAFQLFRGFAVFGVLYLIVAVLQLKTMSFLMSATVNVGLYAIVVVFQPELRRGLEQMGRMRIPFISSGMRRSMEKETYHMIDALVKAAADMSKSKTGALIVIERITRLGDIIDTGTTIDAKLSAELLENIFFHNAPLHDGAVILRDLKLYAAGCYLPLSSNMTIGRELGTRHRSALGMTENSDALVVVVSEETGAMTLAENGKLFRHLTSDELRRALMARLIAPKEENERRDFFRNGKNKEKN